MFWQIAHVMIARATSATARARRGHLASSSPTGIINSGSMKFHTRAVSD